MYQIEKFVFKNCLLLENTEFVFKPGITVVRGDNQDRKHDSENGVGKTYTFSMFPSLILQEQMWARKGLRNTNKEVMSANSSFTSHIKIDGVPYELGYYSKGKTINYSVVENGKTKNLKGIVNQTAYIRELLPQTRHQLFSTYFISSSVPHPLLTGTAPERSEFFESFFDLQFYNALGEAFNKEKYQVDQGARDIDNLEYQLSQHKTSNKPLASIKEEIADAQTRYTKLMKKLERLNKELRDLSAYKAIAEQIENEAGPKALSKLVVSQKELVQKLEKQVAAAAKYKEELEKYKEVTAKRVKIKDDLKKLAKYKQPVEDVKELRTTLKALEIKLERWEEMAEVIKEAKNLNVQPKYSIKKLRIKIKKQLGLLAVSRDTLKSVEQLDGQSSCPCCKQGIDSKLVKQLKAKALNDRTTAKKSLDSLESQLIVADAMQQAGKLYNLDVRKLKDKIEAVQSQVGS